MRTIEGDGIRTNLSARWLSCACSAECTGFHVVSQTAGHRFRIFEREARTFCTNGFEGEQVNMRQGIGGSMQMFEVTAFARRAQVTSVSEFPQAHCRMICVKGKEEQNAGSASSIHLESARGTTKGASSPPRSTWRQDWPRTHSQPVRRASSAKGVRQSRM